MRNRVRFEAHARDLTQAGATQGIHGEGHRWRRHSPRRINLLTTVGLGHQNRSGRTPPEQTVRKENGLKTIVAV